MTHGLRLALPALALLLLVGCQTSGKSKFLPPKSQPVNMPLPSETAKKSTSTPAATLPTPTPPSQPVMTPAKPVSSAAPMTGLPSTTAPSTLPTVPVTPPEQPIAVTPSAIIPPKLDDLKFEKPALPN